MYVEVLRFESLLCVEHQDADIGVLDGTYRTHYRVELEILHFATLLAHAGRVDQIEVHAVLVVSRVDRIARGAGYVGDDVALLAQQGIGHRRLADVGTADDGYTRQIVLLLGLCIFRQGGQYGIHKIARAASRH